MFIEGNISKKIDLLYYLEAYDGSTDTKEVVKFLDTSIVTLKKYVKEINVITNDYKIEIKGNNISLNSNSQQNSILVSKRLLNDSTNLHLLTSIFFHECNLTNLAERLFITKPTVLYKINHLNQYFVEEGLSIEIVYNEYYEIIGNERTIRHFFKVLLLEMNNYEMLQCNQIIFNEIHKFFKKNYRDYHTRHESLVIDTYLLIALTRIAKGYCLYNSTDNLCLTVKTEVMRIYEKLSQKNPFVNFIEANYHVKFSPHLIANIIPLEYIEEILCLKEEYRAHTNKEKEILMILENYLSTYKLSLSKEQKARYLKFLTGQLVTIGPINQIILRDFDINYRKLAEINPKKSKFLYELVTHSNLFSNARESLKYEFIIFFITIIEEIRKDYFGFNQSESIKILLYYSENNIYSEIFEGILKDKYQSHYKIEIDYVNVLYNTYQAQNYDVIISDIYLDDFEGKYLYYSRYPSLEFWQEFEELVM